jgi:hypothetical protein
MQPGRRDGLHLVARLDIANWDVKTSANAVVKRGHGIIFLVQVPRATGRNLRPVHKNILVRVFCPIPSQKMAQSAGREGGCQGAEKGVNG